QLLLTGQRTLCGDNGMGRDHARVDAKRFGGLEITWSEWCRNDVHSHELTSDLIPSQPAVGAAHAAGVEIVKGAAAGLAEHVVETGAASLGTGDREESDRAEQADAGNEDREEDLDDGHAGPRQRGGRF